MTLPLIQIGLSLNLHFTGTLLIQVLSQFEELHDKNHNLAAAISAILFQQIRLFGLRN